MVLRAVIWVLFMFGVCMVLLDKDASTDGGPGGDNPLAVDRRGVARERQESIDVDQEDEERLLRRSRHRDPRRSSEEGNEEEEEEEEEREEERERRGGETRSEAGALDAELGRTAVAAATMAEEQANKVAAKKRFFLGLAVVGTFWFLSVPLMVAIRRAFPKPQRRAHIF
jgi:hypothetical protein